MLTNDTVPTTDDDTSEHKSIASNVMHVPHPSPQTVTSEEYVRLTECLEKTSAELRSSRDEFREQTELYSVNIERLRECFEETSRCNVQLQTQLKELKKEHNSKVAECKKLLQTLDKESSTKRDLELQLQTKKDELSSLESTNEKLGLDLST